MIFVGDDWAEAHHDVYVCDEAGTKLVSRRVPEGIEGIAMLHQLIAVHATDPAEVIVGIETVGDCGFRRSSPPAMWCTRSTRRGRRGIGPAHLVGREVRSG